MSVGRVRRLAVVGALAVTVALSACGGDSSTPTTVAADTSSTVAETGTAASVATTTTKTASTTTSTQTTTPAGSTSTTSEPAGAAAGADISLDAGTVWADVFSTFTVSEHSCIRDAVDEELLESVLDRLVLESSDAPEDWAVSIFSCLAPETARALFLSLMIAGMEGDEELDMELTEEELSCLREWVAGVDVAAAVGALADEDPVVTGELTSGMFSCLNDLLFSVMLEEMGVEFGELGEDEVSCLREWVAGFDMGSMVAGFEDEDPTVLGELVQGLLGCVPDVFLSVMLEEMGVEFRELGEDEASCLREWVAGADFMGLLVGDPDAAFAFLPALLECVPDLLDAPPDPGTSFTMALEEATAVAIDEEVLGELDEPGDFDLFVFEATEGELYQVDVTLGTLDDSVAALYDADETELASNDDYEGSPASRIVWVAPGSGSYYVKVAAWGSGTGSYTLTVVAFEIVDDHANAVGDATLPTSVTVGEVVLGVVDYPGDTDLFVFEATEGELYQLDVTLGTLDDSVAALYDPDEWGLASNDDYGDSSASRIVWEALSSGSYYIHVFAWGDGTGSYTVTVVASDIVDDHANGVGDATSVAAGGAALGVVDYPGDVDMFVFEATEGELYQIDVALGTLPDSEVSLLDPDELELASNDDYEDSSASRLFWEAPSSGSYYIKVLSAWGDGTGSYTLTVVVSDIVDDHADEVGGATSVMAGEIVPGGVDYPGDVDLFVFEATEGELYQIDVALGTLDDSVAVLYDPDEWELAYNDDHEGSLASRIVWEAPDSGSYYIEVSSWGDTGSYTVTVVVSDIVDDHADGVDDATSVAAGGAALGVVDYPGDVDLFVFEAVEGELYQIDAALGTLADSVLVLYDADETQLASNDDYEDSSASRIVWEAPSSGSYYIAASAWGDGTGSYTLTIIVR